MGVSKDVDVDDFLDDDLDGDDNFADLEESLEKRQANRPARGGKGSWRSVEDYMESKRLKNQLSDIFDDDWQ